MQIKLNIKTTNGEEMDVTAIVPDFVAWERYSKRKTSDLATGVGIEDMAYLAYAAIKRSGENVKPFDGWVQNIATIEMQDDETPKAMK